MWFGTTFKYWIFGQLRNFFGVRSGTLEKVGEPMRSVAIPLADYHDAHREGTYTTHTDGSEWPESLLSRNRYYSIAHRIDIPDATDCCTKLRRPVYQGDLEQIKTCKHIKIYKNIQNI